MATIKLKPGMRSTSAKPGDILQFSTGTYDYFTAGGLSGTKEAPILFQFDEGVIFTSGFDLSNVNWLKLDGGTNKNLLIKGATGVPLSFKGKCSNIEITGVKIDGAYSWLWFKTEVGEFTNWDYWTKNADGTISPNYIMDGLKLSNFEFKNAKFDGCYIGSTGQNADRAVVIEGKTYYPLPPKVANIQIENGSMDVAARTGLQVSGLVSGTNYLKNVSIKNCGQSLENYQGACFLIGGNSPAGMEIDGCILDGSNLYAVRTDGAGVIKFTNNTVKNSNTVNGQQRPTKMAAVQFDGVNPGSTFIITGNTVDASNNGVSIVVYGDSKTVSKDSVYANNTLAGKFENQSGVTFKDTTTPPPVTTDPVPVVTKAAIKSVILSSDKTALITREDGTTETIKGVVEVLQQLVSGNVRWAYRTNYQQTVQ